MMLLLRRPSGRRLSMTRRVVLTVALLSACNDPTFPNRPSKLQFASFSTGREHTCARAQKNSIFCWGSNVTRAVKPATTSDTTPEPHQVFLRPLELREVVAGTYYSCGLTRSGAAICWGGEGFFPRTLPGDKPLRTLVAGSFPCGRTEDGTTLCWSSFSAAPGVISGSKNFREVRVGGIACGLTTDSLAACWEPGSLTPVAVPGALQFADIAVGGAHACGLDAAGAAFCWGDNSAGQLGNGSFTPSASPVAVTGGLAFKTIVAMDNLSCGLTTVGGLRCWGLLNGASFNFPVLPISIPGPWNELAIGSSGYFCGRGDDGILLCGGVNDFGQLGDGTTTFRPSAVEVLGQ